MVAATKKTNSRDIRDQKQFARKEGNQAKNESGLNVRRASSPRHSFDVSAALRIKAMLHSLGDFTVSGRMLESQSERFRRSAQT